MTRRIANLAATLLGIIALVCAFVLVVMAPVGMRGPAAIVALIGASCSVMGVLLVCVTEGGEA